MKNNTPSKPAVILALVVVGMALALMTSTSRVIANTFTVTNLNDSGPGSLRQAIIDANANSGADTINFQVGLTGTIALTTGEIGIGGSLTINGPGSDVLTVSGNNSSRVFSIGGTVTISGLTISNGVFIAPDPTLFGGGGIFNSGTLTISNSVISNNSSVNNNGGGGILNAGTLTITYSRLSGNSAPNGAGGGIYNIGPREVTIVNTTLSDNFALNGGGISNGGTLTITNSTVSGNTAGTQGGGIINVDKAAITNSTVSGNTAANFGGGISNSSILTVTNSTLSNNSAAFVGGGIYNFASFSRNATVTISNSTLTGNSAASGGSINNFTNSALATATVNIKNSIVASSPTGGDCSGNGTLNALGVNYSTNGGCPGFINVTAAQLNLGPLQNNGGATETHALLPGSVAIDSVTDCTEVNGTPITTDQRGVMRPQDGDGDGTALCDVGSFEAALLFDLCIQDDSNGNLLQFNSTTGNYKFTNCSKGISLTGKGAVRINGCKIELQDFGPTPKRPDRNIAAVVNTCTRSASASIQLFSPSRMFAITDKNITNNTCACR